MKDAIIYIGIFVLLTILLSFPVRANDEDILIKNLLEFNIFTMPGGGEFVETFYLESAEFDSDGNTVSRFVNNTEYNFRCQLAGLRTISKQTDGTTTGVLEIISSWIVPAKSKSAMDYTGHKDLDLSFDCIEIKERIINSNLMNI